MTGAGGQRQQVTQCNPRKRPIVVAAPFPDSELHITTMSFVIRFRAWCVNPDSRRTAGALSLYGNQTHAFDDDSLEVGLTFATHVALALNILQRDGQLRSALASRDVMGQAKGMAMERFRIDAVAAFELLKRLSQESNTPLTELAERLARPHRPPSRPLVP